MNSESFLIKNKSYLLLGAALFLLFLPLSFASAESCNWFDYGTWDTCLNEVLNSTFGSFFDFIFGFPIRIALLLVTLGTLFPGALTGSLLVILYSLMASLADWLINVSISIGISPGNPLTPEVIKAGWQFTSGFINMFFIVILTFIGLATILRIREYEAQKLLPKLIMIALLINFTPVIVGFVVDAGNLVTNFFITQAGDISAEKVVEQVWNTIWNTALGFLENAEAFITGSLNDALSESIEALGFTIIVSAFCILAIYVYFLVAFIFAQRIVYLWLLMILAPIAFFSSIFPQGGKARLFFPDILGWEKWWEELIKWAIVGIPFGLFIYISNAIMLQANMIFSAVGIPNPSFNIGNLDMSGIFDSFIKLAAYSIGISVLCAGYKISKEAAPAAAKALISQVEGVAKKAGMAATGGVGLAGLVTGGMSRGARGLTRMASKQKGVEERWKDVKGVKGWAGRRYAVARKFITKPVQWTYRATGTPLGLKTSKIVDSKTKEFEEKFGGDIGAAMKIHGGKLVWKGLSSERKAGFALYLAKMKGAAGINKLSAKQQEKAIMSINSHDPSKVIDIVKHDPNLVNDEKIDKKVRDSIAKNLISDPDKNTDYQKLIKRGKTPEEALKEAAFIKAATAIKHTDIKTRDKSTLMGPKNKKLRKIWLERFGPEYFSQIAMHFDQEVMNAFTETAEEIGAKVLAKKNSRMLKYFAVNGQTRWGWQPLKGAETQNKIKKLIKKAEKEASREELEELEASLDTLEQEIERE